MNQKFWNDVELSGEIQKLHRAQNVLDVYHRNGQMGKLFDLLTSMEEAARNAQWRIMDLERKKAEEARC